jgi:hypothetical protein
MKGEGGWETSKNPHRGTEDAIVASQQVANESNKTILPSPSFSLFHAKNKTPYIKYIKERREEREAGITVSS